jgi:septal ring factor EnvC (AmiA/AmiB activator)
MIRRIALPAFCLAAALITANPHAWAEQTPPADKAKLKQVESSLAAKKRDAAALDEKAKETGDSLKSLRAQLIAATEALQSKQEEESRLRDRLDELATDVDAKSKALADSRQKLAELTRALIELGRRPPETLLLQTGLTSDFIHRSILIRAILPRMKEQAEGIARDLSDLHDTEDQLNDQKKLVTAAADNLAKQQHDLDQLIKARQGLLQRTEAQKAAIAAQLVSLSGEAQNLRQLLDEVSPKRSRKSAPPAAGTASLKWPVSGKVLRRFGERDTDGVASQGLTLAALSGAPVVAPRAGKVVFAGPFRGYGQIVILQHEGGYHSFLAGFGRIDADMGQEVDAGEPLGVMPVEPGKKPELYFEWRRNSDPADPSPGLPSM